MQLDAGARYVLMRFVRDLFRLLNHGSRHILVTRSSEMCKCIRLRAKCIEDEDLSITYGEAKENISKNRGIVARLY